MAWEPDIVVDPYFLGDLKDFSGTVTPMAFDLPDLVACTIHSLTSGLGVGWYANVVTIWDGDPLGGGVKSTGFAEAVRIVKDFTTEGDIFVHAVQGFGSIEILIDVALGDPLNLSGTPAAGPVAVWQGVPTDFTITEDDAETLGLIVFYINGTEVQSGLIDTYAVDGNDLMLGESYRLDAVAFNVDGSRAGSLSWEMTVDSAVAAQFDVEVRYDVAGTSGANTTAQILESDFATVVQSWTNPSTQETGNFHVFTALPLGSYYLRTYEGSNWGAATKFEVWAEALDQAGATMISIPHPLGADVYDMGELSFTP
jgi:hypothetical protein